MSETSDRPGTGMHNADITRHPDRDSDRSAARRGRLTVAASPAGIREGRQSPMRDSYTKPKDLAYEDTSAALTIPISVATYAEQPARTCVEAAKAMMEFLGRVTTIPPN